MHRQVVTFAATYLFLVSTVFGDAPVFFRGDEISREHIIYGSIETVSDSAVTINLGHAHGVLVGDRFAIVRVSAGRALPVGRIEIMVVRPAYSLGRFLGNYTPQVGDIAMIRAEELNLWEAGITRSDRLMLNTINQINSGADYDTRRITPRLLDELARDDEALRLIHQPPSPFLTEEEVEPLTMRDANIAGTFRPLAVIAEDGGLRAAESRLAYGGSADLEDALAMLLISLRNQEFEMKMPENVRLGGMRDLDNSRVTQIEQRLAMLVRQTRSLLVGNAPVAPPTDDTAEPANQAQPRSPLTNP